MKERLQKGPSENNSLLTVALLSDALPNRDLILSTAMAETWVRAVTLIEV